MAWNFQNLLSDSPYTGNAAAGTWADFARKMGYTGDPMVTPPADEHYQAPPTLSQDFLDYAKSKGYTFGTNVLNRNDAESGLFQNGSLVDSKLHRNTLRDTGLNRTIDTYLPLAIAAAGAYGALGPGSLGATEAVAPNAIEAAAADALANTGLQAGAFGSSLPMESGFLTGGGGLLTSTVPLETLGSAAADAIAQTGFKVPEFGANAVEGTPLTASSPLTAANGAAPGILSTLQSGASAISQFAKDNPLLAKLGMMAAGGLLSVPGGQSGMSGSAGPAKTWSSPLQTGLLNPVEQRMPAPIQSNPNALAVQGNPYAGAWQYLRGG